MIGAVPVHYYIIGDVHLNLRQPVTDRLFVIFEEILERVAANERIELVLNGDFFEFATLSGDFFSAMPVLAALEQMDRDAPQLFNYFARLTQNGITLHFLAGNHDQELFLEVVQEKVSDLIVAKGGNVRAHLKFPLWMFRPDGNVHIEHGSQYDPNNAVLHPLTIASGPAQVCIYPLGVLMGKFMKSALGDFFNEVTLKSTSSSSFALMGWAIKKYKWRVIKFAWSFIKAAEAVTDYARNHEDIDDVIVAEREELYAQKYKIPVDIVRMVRSFRVVPTIVDPAKTRARLYINRVYLLMFVLLLLPTWLFLPFLFGPFISLLIVPLFKELRRRDLYAGEDSWQMAIAAKGLRVQTNVQYVVFSHNHIQSDEDGYLNTGSLSFPRSGAQPSFLELTSFRGRFQFKHRQVAL